MRLGAKAEAMKESRAGAGAGQRQGGAEAVDQPADDHRADAEADHRQRVGQRRIRPLHGEIGLHRGQRHHHGPHADAADGADQQRGCKPHPGVGRFCLAGGRIVDCVCRSVHGAATICVSCRRVK
jgi:hypothetical protein